jgi:hypothetical protein
MKNRQQLQNQYVEDADEDDTVSSSKFMGMNGSYIHHLNNNNSNNNRTTNTTDEMDIFAKHLKLTAAGKGISSMNDRFRGGTNHQSTNDRKSSSQYSKSSSSSSSSHRPRNSSVSGHRSHQNSIATLEDSYTRAMNRVSRGGDYYYYDPKQPHQHNNNDDDHDGKVKQQQHLRHSSSSEGQSSNVGNNRKQSSSSARTSSSSTSNRPSNISNSSGDMAIPSVPKKSVSTKDPSEETIAVFGAYGVTGHYFLQLAMEAGYKVRALVLPGITLDDVSPASENLRLITGSFDEEEKVRRVVKNASYVVCLLNDCNKSLQLKRQQEDARTCAANLENIPPILIPNNEGAKDGKTSACSSNLKFMQTLLPILDELDKCRVILYQVRFGISRVII